MSRLETFSDLKIAALEKAGELTDGTSDYDTTVEEQINALNRSIYSGANEFNVDLGEPWEWAKPRNPGVLTLIPPFETGTISLTQDSASATLSSAPAVGLGSLKNHFLIITGISTVYRISAHTANATAVTLDQIYLEDTAATASFKIVKLDYDLTAGIERLIGPMRTYKANNDDASTEISGIDRNAFDRLYPLARPKSGIPERFSVIAEANGLLTVRFSHYQAEDKIRVEYDYIPVAPTLVVKTFLDAGVTAGSDLITLTDHQFQDNQQVQLTTTGVLPAGLSLLTSYFIISATATTFKLSATEGGLAVDITAASGGGTHKISTIPAIPHSHRKALCHGATHFVLVDKSDSRSDYYMRLTQASLQALVASNRKMKRHVSKNRGRLITRPDQKGPWNRKGPEAYE